MFFKFLALLQKLKKFDFGKPNLLSSLPVEIFEIVLAANYLHIVSLMELACAKIASLIKGKSTDEIRKTFNIVNDFT